MHRDFPRHPDEAATGDAHKGRDLNRLINLLRDSDSATRTLAAWVGHPVHLEVLSRCNDQLVDAELDDLDIWHHEPVQRRKVRLLSGCNLLLSEATATVVLGRVPGDTALALQESNVPLGTALAPLRVRRHTLRVVRRERASCWHADMLFSIDARLDLRGRPVAMVHERYFAGVLT
jgi:chorismate-pyruvate lyase